jgi:hypothetical protein
MTLMFEITSGWMEQYVSALMLLNILLGQPTATSAMNRPTPESLVLTLNEIAQGRYRPAQYFTAGGARLSFPLHRNELVATKSYTVILLNATTPESDFASVNTGGVIFEDPAWAVFAAECIGHGQMLGVPTAQTDDELWKELPRIEKAVRHSTYSPSNFFSPITGFIDSPGPSFRLTEISGAQLTALRARGIQSFGNPTPKFYILFRPQAVNH